MTSIIIVISNIEVIIFGGMMYCISFHLNTLSLSPSKYESMNWYCGFMNSFSYIFNTFTHFYNPLEDSM